MVFSPSLLGLFSLADHALVPLVNPCLHYLTDALGLLPGRVTFVIDKQGLVRHIFIAQFAAEKHVEEAMRVLQTLRREHE